MTEVFKEAFCRFEKWDVSGHLRSASFADFFLLLIVFLFFVSEVKFETPRQ